MHVGATTTWRRCRACGARISKWGGWRGASTPRTHHSPMANEKTEAEWVWGWDPTPGIVSVWAEDDGRAFVWRRLQAGDLVCEQERFRPWLLLRHLDDVRDLGELATYRELAGPGQLRFLVSASDLGSLSAAVVAGALRLPRSLDRKSTR